MATRKSSGNGGETDVGTAARNAPRTVDDVPQRRTRQLVGVRNASDIVEDLFVGNWIKKPDLCDMGPFNIIGVSKRANSYKGKHNTQYVFEVQFCDDANFPDQFAQRALCSMDENVVREKYFNAVKKFGGIGPLELKRLHARSEEMSDAYVFTAPGVDPNDADVEASEGTDTPE